jgi:hypothetical protein
MKATLALTAFVAQCAFIVSFLEGEIALQSMPGQATRIDVYFD